MTRLMLRRRYRTEVHWAVTERASLICGDRHIIANRGREAREAMHPRGAGEVPFRYRHATGLMQSRNSRLSVCSFPFKHVMK